MSAIAPHQIKLTELPWLPFEWKQGLPTCAAVYIVLSSNDEVLYVGQSLNIRNRWQSHHMKRRLAKLSGVRIAWLQMSDSILLPSVETALIEFFQPKLNRPATKKKKEYNPKTALIALRKRANLTQRQVAKEMEVTVQSVSNWETGLSEPLLTLKQTLTLCRVLQCSLEELDAAVKNN